MIGIWQLPIGKNSESLCNIVRMYYNIVGGEMWTLEKREQALRRFKKKIVRSVYVPAKEDDE